MMALDAKTIKEELPDKEVYERRSKGKDRSKTPDSPESAKAIAPKSPMSPIHHSSSGGGLVTTRSGNVTAGSCSPIVNGSGAAPATTPPPASSAATAHAVTPIHLQDSQRILIKVRRFLGALVQFGQDINPDIGDRVRALILSLASGGLTPEEFKIALQDTTNFPLRPYVLPFLKSNVPILQREIASLARSNNQSTLQYVRANESNVFEFERSQTEHSDIFIAPEVTTNGGNGSLLNGNGNNGIGIKRRTSDSLYDHQNGPASEWNDYIVSAKRPNNSVILSSANHLFPGHPTLFDYHNAAAAHGESFLNLSDKTPHSNHSRERDDREIRSLSVTETAAQRNRSGGEDEWKNIHTMLNCISAMVDKTKRAITILQQRGIETHGTYQDASLCEMKRQTEEKVAEFRRSAEDAVNQVKRQAMIEIQRAVASAESRAIDMIAQERIKMEKMISDVVKTNSDDSDTQTTIIPGSQNTCWNCGRKANETCSGCNLARYCGSFCQHKDWEQHHQVCGRSEKHQTPTAQQRLTTVAAAAVSTVVPVSSRASPPQVPQSTPTSLTNGTPIAGGIK